MFINRPQIITRSNLKLITKLKPTFNQTKSANYQLTRNFTSTRRNPNQSIFSTLSDSYDQTIQELSINFLSQPISSNISYVTQTILITLSLRSLITLPISIWSKNRIKRYEENVIPEFKEFKSLVAKKAKRKFGSELEIGVYQNSLKKLFRNELKRLQSLHKCRPITTLLGSITIHIPLIYLMTNVLRRSCEIASQTTPAHLLVLEKSPVLGDSLVMEDLGLAVGCWMAFLINLEFNWALRSNKDVEKKEKNEGVLSKGLGFWTQDRIRNAGFFTGVFMMGYASFQPALVLVYWLTSNSFSIFQSLWFDWIDKRRQKKKVTVGLMKFKSIKKIS